MTRTPACLKFLGADRHDWILGLTLPGGAALGHALADGTSVVHLGDKSHCGPIWDLEERGAGAGLLLWLSQRQEACSPACAHPKPYSAAGC